MPDAAETALRGQRNVQKLRFVCLMSRNSGAIYGVEAAREKLSPEIVLIGVGWSHWPCVPGRRPKPK